MDPIPETSEAVEDYGPFAPDGDLLGELRALGDKVSDLVPDCVGLSLASREHGVSFTLVASEEFIAALDGLQYLDGGPCVEAVEAERVLQFTGEELMGEEGWRLFARGTAAAAVASTLTLPIMVEGQVMGSINLYAASPDAFTGKHEEVAAVFGAWAPGAVANADLSFLTRRTAEQAPRLLYEEMRIQVAVGVLIASERLDDDAARRHLSEAASRAGVSEAALAETIIRQANFGGRPLDEQP
jgi:GAF domain-containing protein